MTYYPMIQLSHIATERRNPESEKIDTLDTLEILRLINKEDQKVPQAIAAELPKIANAVDCIAARLQSGGRLFYLGAGTSGRLGVLDAAECPPTYGTDPSLVQGIIAGGMKALLIAREGAEDSDSLAAEDLQAAHFCAKDVLVGIAASGRTPYVIGGLRYAGKIGAATVSLSCSPDSPIAKLADIPLTIITGPEIITGSTRMKAGTAQKMVLNMLSTATMIRLGKVYGNLMIDVKASNKKLEERARSIVMEATGCSRSEAIDALNESDGRAKLAVFLLLTQLPADSAKKILAEANGHIRLALEKLTNKRSI